MRESILTILVVLLVSFTSHAVASNREAFQAASEATSLVNALVKDGATDSDCMQVDSLMSRLETLRPSLSSDQQKALWEKSPYFAGIACSWSFSHDWQGNDCLYQCGSLSECMKGGSK
jgi:hypothetical protein